MDVQLTSAYGNLAYKFQGLLLKTNFDFVG